jgi:WD40 repeat protein
VISVSVFGDGRRAISASRDKTLKLWDLEAGAAIATFAGEGEMTACAVAPDNRTVVAGEESGRLHFLRLEERE